MPPLATLAIIWQMKPVMWNSGASDTMPEPGGRPAFRAAIREFDEMFACACTAPLARPEVPDV